jgi:hypothetical protein
MGSRRILGIIVSIPRIRDVLISSCIQFCVFVVVPKYLNVKGYVRELFCDFVLHSVDEKRTYA